MAAEVLKWTFGFLIDISAKLKVSAPKPATTQSRETLYAIVIKSSDDCKLVFFGGVV